MSVIQPVALSTANRFVWAWHRHSKPVVVLGVIGWWQWALAEERHEIERQWRRDHA